MILVHIPFVCSTNTTASSCSRLPSLHWRLGVIMTLIQTKHSASAAVFSPQSTAPKPTHLAHIRARLLEDDLLKPVKEAVVSLPKTWRALVSKQPELGKNRKASDLIEAFPSWIEDGKTEVLETDMSGLITLPLLAVIHIVQYLDYIQRLGISHSEFLESVESGGVQGYCIGLLSAIVVSSAEDEEALIQHAAHGIRLSLAIGAFGDIGSSPDEVDSNTLQVRLRNAGSEEDLVARFPGVSLAYISKDFRVQANACSPTSRPLPTLRQ